MLLTTGLWTGDEPGHVPVVAKIENGLPCDHVSKPLLHLPTFSQDISECMHSSRFHQSKMLQPCLFMHRVHHVSLPALLTRSISIGCIVELLLLLHLPRMVRMACFAQVLYVPIHVSFHCICATQQLSDKLDSRFRVLESQCIANLDYRVHQHVPSLSRKTRERDLQLRLKMGSQATTCRSLYCILHFFPRTSQSACIRQAFTSLRCFSLACECTECIMFPCKLYLLDH